MHHISFAFFFFRSFAGAQNSRAAAANPMQLRCVVLSINACIGLFKKSRYETRKKRKQSNPVLELVLWKEKKPTIMTETRECPGEHTTRTDM